MDPCVGVIEPSRPLETLRRRVVPAGAPAASENDEMDVGQPEQVILDPNAMAKAVGGTYFELGGWTVRP